MPTEKNEALLPDPHVRHEGNTSAADDNTEQKTAHQKPVCRSNKNEKCFAETSAAIGTEPGQRRTRRNPRCRTTFKRKSRRNSAALMFNWCPGGDSNSHAIRRYHLKIVCLPIPPPGHEVQLIEIRPDWQVFFYRFNKKMCFFHQDAAHPAPGIFSPQSRQHKCSPDAQELIAPASDSLSSTSVPPSPYGQSSFKQIFFLHPMQTYFAASARILQRHGQIHGTHPSKEYIHAPHTDRSHRTTAAGIPRHY